MKEIYTFRSARRERESVSLDSDYYERRKVDSPVKGLSGGRRPSGEYSEERLEDMVNLAVLGDDLDWNILPESEMPSRNSAEKAIAHYTKIHVPVFYGEDVELYGGNGGNREFFEIYLRKYYWGHLDLSRPIKHVILVAGGPGEAGSAWIGRLNSLSRQYGRSNIIFYIADHRGVYKSRDVVELISRETTEGKTRTSWRRVNRNDHVNEREWMQNVREFERKVGYPLVSMTCSNAARDLALVSLVLAKHMTQPGDRSGFYLHAQSYGTQLSTRTLVLLPNFYEAVLFEGLATMELVKESAKADFGVLSSCAEDRECAKMFRTPLTRSGSSIPLEGGVFDLRKLLQDMTEKPHNRACRDHFHEQMRLRVYSETISFWSALHLSFYEMLADDFINPYTGTKGNFYPGILVLHLLRDMYYCVDIERFKRQVDAFIEVHAVSVRGLEFGQQLKSSSKKKSCVEKEKPTDASKVTSYFVQTYINAHEAFDMVAMERSSESSYCDRPDQKDLVNQCPIWKEQVRKLTKLKEMTLTTTAKPSRKKKEKRQKNSVLDKFEGTEEEEEEEKEEDSDEEDSDSNDDEEERYKSNLKGGARSKKNKKKKKSKQRSKNSSKEYPFFKNIKWTRASKQEEEVNPSRGPKTIRSIKRFYYDIDDLAYAIPETEKTRIFVAMGTLDVKTPLMEARRLWGQMGAPHKSLFELTNVAHSPGPCRTEILRAFTAVGRAEQAATLEQVEGCVQELKRTRKLDWALEDVKRIRKEDWLQG